MLDDQGTEFLKIFFTFCLKLLLLKALRIQIKGTPEGSPFLKYQFHFYIVLSIFLEVNRTGIFMNLSHERLHDFISSEPRP